MSRLMVERRSGHGDSPPVPTISELLAQYRDRTGASYDEMSRSVNGEITTAWFHKLTTQPPKSFPRDADTVQALADLLQVPVATIVLAFASSLGLPVTQSSSMLLLTLPPGTDNLQPADVAAIRAIVRQLVEARRAVSLPEPDLSRVEGLRIEEESTSVSDPVTNGRNDG
jgi:hypothetical protein